jgi:hypothetical protein
VGGAAIGTQVGAYITTHLLLPASRGEGGDGNGVGAPIRVGLLSLAGAASLQPAALPTAGAGDPSQVSPPPAASVSGVNGAQNSTDPAQSQDALLSPGGVRDPLITAIDGNLPWEALANDLTVGGAV